MLAMLMNWSYGYGNFKKISIESRKKKKKKCVCVQVSLSLKIWWFNLIFFFGILIITLTNSLNKFITHRKHCDWFPFRNWSKFSVSRRTHQKRFHIKRHLWYFSGRAWEVIIRDKFGFLFLSSTKKKKEKEGKKIRNFKLARTVQLNLDSFRGTYGTVYVCREKSSGLRLAAKYVKVTCKEDRRTMEQEIEIMSGLHHPRIIQLYDAYDDGSTIVCVLEL